MNKDIARQSCKIVLKFVHGEGTNLPPTKRTTFAQITFKLGKFPNF